MTEAASVTGWHAPQSAAATDVQRVLHNDGDDGAEEQLYAHDNNNNNNNNTEGKATKRGGGNGKGGMLTAEAAATVAAATAAALASSRSGSVTGTMTRRRGSGKRKSSRSHSRSGSGSGGGVGDGGDERTSGHAPARRSRTGSQSTLPKLARASLTGNVNSNGGKSGNKAKSSSSSASARGGSGGGGGGSGSGSSSTATTPRTRSSGKTGSHGGNGGGGNAAGKRNQPSRNGADAKGASTRSANGGGGGNSSRASSSARSRSAASRASLSSSPANSRAGSAKRTTHGGGNAGTRSGNGGKAGMGTRGSVSSASRKRSMSTTKPPPSSSSSSHPACEDDDHARAQLLTSAVALSENEAGARDRVAADEAHAFALLTTAYQTLVMDMVRTQVADVNARQRRLDEMLGALRAQGVQVMDGVAGGGVSMEQLTQRLREQLSSAAVTEAAQLRVENAALRDRLHERDVEVEKKVADVEVLRNRAARQLARSEIEHEALRTEVRMAVQRNTLNVEHMKEELCRRLDMAIASVRTPQYNTALRSLQEAAAVAQADVQSCHDTLQKLIVSIGAKDTFLKDESNTMHSNLPAAYREGLRTLDKDHLLNVLDVLSFQDGVVDTVGKALYVLEATSAAAGHMDHANDDDSTGSPTAAAVAAAT